MPITIGAEQGLIGLAAYAGVLLAAFMTLFGNGAARLRAPPETDGTGAGTLLPARAALAAMFFALVVHTMGYASFLEDPFTWVILALGASLAPYARLAKVQVRAPARSSQPVAAPAS